MNILDIAENSLRANANTISISITQTTQPPLQTLVLQDDGCGMRSETLAKVTDPFYTTRTTRKVGLGLPFLKMQCEMAGGALTIQSALGKGTTVTATFVPGHIDLMPLGDIGSTIATLLAREQKFSLQYTAAKNDHSFCFRSTEISEFLGEVPLATPAVQLWVRDYINENTAAILGQPAPKANITQEKEI